MTRTEIVEKAKEFPTGQVDTEVGMVEWTCWGDRMNFRSLNGFNNVVNRVEMRIRFDIKLVDGAWRRDSLSANRVGNYDDVSWAAREKIERTCLAEAIKLFTPIMAVHAKAASAWSESRRKLNEVAECKEKLAELEKHSDELLVEYGKALDAFDKELP